MPSAPAVDFGHLNLHNKQPFFSIGQEQSAFNECVKIEDRSGSSAYHMPYGSLFAYKPGRLPETAARTRVSTLAVAPAILDHFSIQPPPYMAAPLNSFQTRLFE